MFTKEMIEERRKCITGTEISAIIGVNPWSSPLKVYLDKKGLLDPVVETPNMEWGKRLEDIIANKYSEERANIPLNKGFWIRDGIYGGTPDYFTCNKIIEIKTTGRSTGWGEAGTDQIPEHYICQVQWYMMLKMYESADIAVLIGGNDYRVYTVQYQPKLVSLLKKEAEKFWVNHIVNDVAPQASKPDDSKLIYHLFPTHDSEIIERPSLDYAAFGLNERKARLSVLEEDIARYEMIIKNEIGNNAGVKGAMWQATWKRAKDSKKTDWNSLAKEIKISQDLIEKHTITVPGTRKFLLKFKEI